MSAKIYFVAHLLKVLIFFLCLRISHSGRIRRIVNGMPVLCGEQPRVASIRNSTTGQHLCGTTLVSPEFAITAAHCVLQPVDQYVLRLNNYCVGENETYPEADVVDIIIYDQYDRYSSTHDIAILQIRLELNNVTWLNESVLPASSFGLSSDDCSIYGYGYTNPLTTEVSERLLEGRVETMSLDECIERLGPYVAPAYDSGMMCAVGESGADACQGDSGGPLFCGNSTILQGVSSYGMSCGVSGLPGVYTSIGAHLNWIRTVLNKGTQNQTTE
ncbi:serine protease 42-like [Ostrinia nubilalis]|uniref:serine protease 42-like n=1 Tax=Ostrinia nubilalis TaxID=29057 RepID=UPI00308238D6